MIYSHKDFSKDMLLSAYLCVEHWNEMAPHKPERDLLVRLLGFENSYPEGEMPMDISDRILWKLDRHERLLVALGSLMEGVKGILATPIKNEVQK